MVTQCLKSTKCLRANAQYFSNVVLKLNAKLGGTNAILAPGSTSFLNDPAHPTLILGADVVHPAPGPTGKPSFAAVVGSVDSNGAKYVAATQIQEARKEIIEDLETMVMVSHASSFLAYPLLTVACRTSSN